MTNTTQKLGWIGVGRMGGPMAARLLAAGHSVAIWNRTKAKADPFAKRGARVVEGLAELSDVDVVFTMVSEGRDPGRFGDKQQRQVAENIRRLLVHFCRRLVAHPRSSQTA
jgi:3-hydroxyisobutyrate dehydrogenase-like beta-hydroxyacid dehydrogenase